MKKRSFSLYLSDARDSGYINMPDLVTEYDFNCAIAAAYLQHHGVHIERTYLDLNKGGIVVVRCKDQTTAANLRQSLACVFAAISFGIEADLYAAKARMKPLCNIRGADCLTRDGS